MKNKIIEICDFKDDIEHLYSYKKKAFKIVALFVFIGVECKL